MSGTKKYRYPGVKPFETAEQDLFFGRDRDIEDLLDLIWLEKLVVLFGKSGYGKSSLLNAGILPRLDDVASVVVRFGSYVEGQTLPPLENLRLKTDEALTDDAAAGFLATLGAPKSLWLQLKRKQNRRRRRFIFVFDQFEEFFSYPVAEQNAFKEQLAELLYTEIPQAVRNAAETLDAAQQAFIAAPFDAKVVFAIRADRMSLLDSMKDRLPAILHKRYELRGLTADQARDAIQKPAGIAGDRFDTPPFEYTETALTRILRELNTSAPGGGREATIEAFQLQILCEHLESAVRDGRISDRDDNGLPDVTEADLPEMSGLYENYYRRKLDELEKEIPDPAVRLAAQRVLEDGLLAEDGATGEGRRMSVDSRALIAQFSHLRLTDALLKALANTFLIRPELNTVGGVSYEISHDTLIAPIQKAKAVRKAEEARLETIRRQEEAEQKARDEAAKRLEAEGQRRRARMLAGAAVVGLALALVAMFWAFSEQQKAQQALSDRIEADRKREAAEAANRKNDFEKDLQLANGQLSGGGSCLDEVTFDRLQRAMNEMRDADVKTKIENLNRRIRENSAGCPVIVGH
jgi:hypothetical protein